MTEEKITVEETKEFSKEYKNIANKIELPEEFYARYTEAINQNLSPSFRDIKKAIKQVAKLTNEPVGHIIMEVYGFIVGKKIAIELRKETKNEIKRH